MFSSQKVVWAEGVFLGQQHFQQWEKSIHAYQQFLHRYQFNNAYGLCKLVINQGKLHHNELQIDALMALMPDGRMVHYINENDEPLLTISLSEEEGSVYLALPKSEVVRGISGYPETELENTAWQAEYKPCQDIYDKTKEVEILYAKQHCFLTTDKRHAQTCCLMKISAFQTQLGVSTLSKSYIAPLLTIEASSVLMDMIMSINGLLSSLILTFQTHFNTQPSSVIRDNAGQSYTLILLAILARYSTRLSAFENKMTTDVKALYLCFCELISELTVCSGEPFMAFKPYKPEALTELFTTSSRLIKALLEKITPQDNQTLLLIETSKNLYVSGQLFEQIKPTDFLYLEVCEYHENEGWALRFERGVKLGAASKIKDIYDSAVAGVKLKYTKRPPSAIAIKPNCEYFQVLCEGEYWQQVIEEGQLGILKSSAFSSVTINLVIVSG